MKKNYYPLAIFSFLVLMVCCIVASVVIAIRDPALEDTSYFSQKKLIDSHINEIIKKHNLFLSKCQLYLDTQKTSKFQETHQILPPYLIKANHAILQISHQNLYLIPSCKQAKDLKITLFFEKINSNKEREKIGKMHWKKDLFISPKIPDFQPGRYKAIFKIQEANETFFFEKEIFFSKN